MLQIVRPKDHDPSKFYIDSLLGFLEAYSNFKLSLDVKDRAVFIHTEDDKWSSTSPFYGGAVLYPQKVSSSLELLPYDSHEETLGKLFSTFLPEEQEYWVARIFFCLDKDDFASDIEINETVNNFYENLYNTFKDFGEQEWIEYLPFTLPVIDTLNTFAHKNWPYLLEVRPSGSTDEFFHGILSLKEQKFKIRKIRSSVIPFPIHKTRLSFQNQSVSSGRME